MRGKQSVRKGVWYMGGRKKRGRKIYRKQMGIGLPLGLIASAAAPFLGEAAKRILKKIFVGRKRRRQNEKLSCPIERYLAKQ